jgi:single-strand DNA-binding protein
MKTKNRIDLIGFVGRDPDVSYRPDGTILNVRFSLATTERWTGGAGEKKERTEWHRVVFWDRAAEQLAKFLHAGSFVEVEGSMQSSAYEQDGVRRTSWQVRGAEYRLLDRAPGDGATAAAPDAPEPSDSAESCDDLPL